MSGQLYIRSARPADQEVIRRLVREAGINPLGLHWPNFLIAQAGDEVVGIGQVKPHGDGSRELASIAAAPHRQGEGIASALVRELLRRESGTTYLYCREELLTYYARFGYEQISGSALPPSMRRIFRISQVLSVLLRAFTGERLPVVAMRREP